MNKLYYATFTQFDIFFNLLKKDYKVYTAAAKEPVAEEGQVDYYYRNVPEKGTFEFNPYRPVEPLKSFFTPFYEKVITYFKAEEDVVGATEETIVFGVKSCDLVGHKIQDFVFLEGVEEDSAYRLRREKTILVSGDCTGFREVCHCLAWEILPYPTEGFDLNLAALSGGYLVEIGTRKGEELIQQYKEYFVEADENQVAERKANRQKLIERLKDHLLPQHLVSKDDVQRLVKQGFNSDTWQQFMLTCVECGGCNLICDTCHCFLLADQKEDVSTNRKIKVWDSCLYTNYARVAGGANPLKTRAQRLRNRFMKKFDFFIENLGMPACCGCGRCIEVCPGKIDIREVLKDLAAKVGVKQ